MDMDMTYCYAGFVLGVLLRLGWGLLRGEYR